MRRGFTVGVGIVVALCALVTAPVAGQGSAAQIQAAIRALLAGTNTWTGSNTFGAITVNSCTGCGGGSGTVTTSSPLSGNGAAMTPVTLAPTADVTLTSVQGKDGLLTLMTDGDTHIINGLDATNVRSGDVGSGGVGQVLQIGVGLSATSAAAALSAVTQIGASLVQTLTDSGSLGDITMIGEHMTITDENAPQSYGLALGGGSADINVLGGNGWTVIANGQGNNDLDYFQYSAAIGADIDFHASDLDHIAAWHSNYLFGLNIDLTDSGNIHAFGHSITVNTITGDGNFFIGQELTASTTTAGPVFEVGYYLDNGGFGGVFMFGVDITATADNQIWFGSPDYDVFMPAIAIDLQPSGALKINGASGITGTGTCVITGITKGIITAATCM